MGTDIYCVAPVTFDGYPSYFIMNKILELAKKDEKMKEKIFEVTKENNQIKKKTNRYTTLLDDSFLEKDQFAEVKFNFADGIHVSLLVGSTNYIVLKTVYSINNSVKLDKIQMDVNKYINKIVVKLRNYFGFESIEGVNYFKWVNRTLQCDEDFISKNENEIMTKWLFCEESIKEKLLVKKYYLAWGNNLICNNIDKRKLDNIFDSLSIMQYYYAVLDDTNNEIRDVLNSIDYQRIMSEKKSNKKNRIKKNEFEEAKIRLYAIRNKVSNIIIKYNDDLISLQSYKKFFSEKIMTIWEVDKLLTSIEYKIKLCEDILGQLENRIVKRSLFITDMILFLIGLSGVLSFTLYLGELLDNQVNKEISGFNNIFSNIPFVMREFLTNSFTGVLNLFSLLILFLLVVSYMNYKRR